MGIIFSLALSLLPDFVFAQERKDNAWDRLKTDVNYMGDGFLYVVSSPIRWKGKDWLKLAGFAGATYLVTFVDDPFNNWAVRTNNPTRRESLENFADLIGKPAPALISFSLLYTTGVIIDNQKLRDAGVLIFSSLGATALFQTISKTATGRARPISGYDKFLFKPFNNDPDFHSFPSGHAMSAMTITSVIAQLVNFKPAKYALYGLGVSVAFARSYNEAHWVSDVLVSAGITYLAVRTANRRYEYKKSLKNEITDPTPKARLNFQPTLNGFRLNLVFP